MYLSRVQLAQNVYSTWFCDKGGLSPKVKPTDTVLTEFPVPEKVKATASAPAFQGQRLSGIGPYYRKPKLYKTYLSILSLT